MTRLETMRRFELPGYEYDREPPERDKCVECFGDIAKDAPYRMCIRCRRKAVAAFQSFLRGLSKSELDMINDMCDGTDLHDLAGR